MYQNEKIVLGVFIFWNLEIKAVYLEQILVRRKIVVFVKTI